MTPSASPRFVRFKRIECLGKRREAQRTAIERPFRAKIEAGICRKPYVIPLVAGEQVTAASDKIARDGKVRSSSEGRADSRFPRQRSDTGRVDAMALIEVGLKRLLTRRVGVTRNAIRVADPSGIAGLTPALNSHLCSVRRASEHVLEPVVGASASSRGCHRSVGLGYRAGAVHRAHGACTP